MALSAPPVKVAIGAVGTVLPTGGLAGGAVPTGGLTGGAVPTGGLAGVPAGGWETGDEEL